MYFCIQNILIVKHYVTNNDVHTGGQQFETTI